MILGRGRRGAAPPSPSGGLWRRTVVILVVALVVGLPAGVLRAMCAGRSCDSTPEAVARVPFCSLPDVLRSRIAAGYRDGRSGEVFGIADRALINGNGVEWPSTQASGSGAAIAFFGTGVDGSAAVPDSTTLDAVAPTIAEIIGLRRPHPEVRSGEAVAGVADGSRPKLVLEVVLKNVGAPDLDAGESPFLERVWAEGAATLGADTGSVPADPAATITTIGTGGLPRQHGITGRLIRNDAGRLVHAWRRGSPPSVIATLADDLDELNDESAHIGLIAADASDRGLIGGNWYIDVDRDDVVVSEFPRGSAAAARRMLRTGYGNDGVPDLLGIVLDGDLGAIDKAVEDVYQTAKRAAGSVALVVASTGSDSAGDPDLLPAQRVARLIEAATGAPLVEGVVAGAIFSDQRVLAEREISEDEIVQALTSIEWDGRRVFVDAFPAISISFERYCR